MISLSLSDNLQEFRGGMDSFGVGKQLLNLIKRHPKQRLWVKQNNQRVCNIHNQTFAYFCQQAL